MTKRQEYVKKAIKYLKDYMETYDKQLGYLDYKDETIIDDVLRKHLENDLRNQEDA